MLASFKGYLIAAGAVLVIGLLIGAYFKGRYDVTKVDVPKFASIAQQAKDEAADAHKTDIANNFITKDAYNELQTKLAGYSGTVDDLTQRLQDATTKQRPVIVSGPMVATCKPADSGPVGSAEASNPGAVGPATAEVEVSTLPTEVLRDDLTLTLQNIEALQVVIEARAKVQQ